MIYTQYFNINVNTARHDYYNSISNGNTLSLKIIISFFLSAEYLPKIVL